MDPPSISEEIQDLMMSSDEEAPKVYFPPSRVTARFNRHPNSRRKTSAASSRRNSISSHHSNRSTLSTHGGPQSTHIAQHLRRASILENRKARLADKAAHAEEVRLRAAMAKAAPRTSTNSEIRVAAAIKARERHLAQVAAHCAEEVQRAKRVAEDTREKKAAENLKLKGDMEERLAEAERRRVLYQQSQRRTRATFLPPVEEKKFAANNWKPRNDDEAARLIQKAWRNRQRRHVVHNFMQLGLTVDSIKKTEFEDVGALLSQEKVLACTSNIMKLCGLHDNDGASAEERTAVRIFLSTFLILGHPDYVLSQEGVQEQDLIAKAEQLLLSFGSVISSPQKTSLFSPLSSQLAALAESYASFQSAFLAWKDHDASVLLQTMLAQFVELDAIWQTVKNDTDGGVAEDYREGIQRNQTQLLVRLKRLAGPEKAMDMIRLAVRANRKTKSKKKYVGDIRPRAIQSEPPIDQVHQLSSQPATHSWKSTSLVPDNRTVVHELAINKEYRIDIKSRVDTRGPLNQAISQSMRDSLELGDSMWIVGVAEIIREKLLRLVVPGKSLYNLISETLDLKLIADQVTLGSFSYERFYSFMNSILPKLCAPVRDAEVRALVQDQNEDPIERLAKLIYVIDLLLLDHANFTLQTHAPMLRKEAASYEQGCFSKMVETGSPSRTIQWWNHARARAVEDASRRAADGVSYLSTRLTPERIYSQGLVDLAIAVTKLDDHDLPETLELDRERILRMRSDVLRMITIDAILLTAKNLLKRDVRSQWKLEAQRMWNFPYENVQNFFSIIDSRHTMPFASKNQLSATIERVLNEARTGQASHPVMKVLLRKLKTHILTRLTASSAEDRVRATSTAGETLASSGLCEFVGEIGRLVDELAIVGEVDRAAHGKWYDEISSTTLQDSSL